MGDKFSTKIITRTAISIALGFLLAMVKLFHLPFGGSITFCSTLFIILPGYWFGIKIGIIAGIISGLIKFIFSPVFLHPLQFFLDYILAFAFLGLGSVFKKTGKNHSLVKGYIFCMALKFVCAFLSGIVFFKNYAPQNISPILYSFLYNFSYITIETIMTIILISIPAFKNVLKYLAVIDE